jgi:hypothetical protein
VEARQVRAGQISSALGNTAQALGVIFSGHAAEVGALSAEVRGVASLKSSLQRSQHLLDGIFAEIELLENGLVKHARTLRQQPEGADMDEGGDTTRMARAVSGGMTKVVDNALSSLSRRISRAGSGSSALGLGRRGSTKNNKRNVIKIRTNSEVSFDEDSDIDNAMHMDLGSDEDNIDSI